MSSWSLKLTRALKAVIPGRHPERLNRLPYWILLFKTPFRAASYQSRLRWYHQNAVDNLPMNPLQAAQIPGRGLTPPPGYIDPETGDDVWKRLREYALLQPAQRFSITALLPKFPPTIVRDIQRHERWTMASGIRSWTVRIWLDGDQLTKDRFCRFLQEDGEARNRAWGLASQWSTGVPEDDQSRHTPVQAVTETGTAWRGAETIQNLVVTFSNESEAVKFWRTWHRRPFPTTADGAGPGHGAPLLNVELMW